MKALFLLLFSMSAMAIDCGSEIQKLCENNKTDFAKCIKESMSKLPAECRKEVNGFDSMAGDIAISCMGDLQKYCPIDLEGMATSMETTALKQAECLKKNKSKFSSKCNDLLNKISDSLGGSIEGGAKTKSIR